MKHKTSDLDLLNAAITIGGHKEAILKQVGDKVEFRHIVGALIGTLRILEQSGVLQVNKVGSKEDGH